MISCDYHSSTRKWKTTLTQKTLHCFKRSPTQNLHPRLPSAHRPEVILLHAGRGKRKKKKKPFGDSHGIFLFLRSNFVRGEKQGREILPTTKPPCRAAQLHTLQTHSMRRWEATLSDRLWKVCSAHLGCPGQSVVLVVRYNEKIPSISSQRSWG